MKGKGASFDGGPVGYKRPPVEHQFKKGQKPPGSGRRRETKNFEAIIGEALESKVTVTENGRKSRIPVKQALVKKAVFKGLNGNVNDILRLFALFERLAPAFTTAEPPTLYIRNIAGDEDE